MEENVKGIVFDISHFAVGDGPGIRTVVFLKGCPLRCKWCHNPESYIKKPQLRLAKENCVLCGKCEAVCKNNCHIISENEHKLDFAACSLCGKCIDVCVFSAIEKVGKELFVSEVLKEIKEDEFFYETSNGGLTVSGGEPMNQADFTIALSKAAKENNINVCLETSGFCKREDLEKIKPYIDIFLYDFKISNSEKHKKYIGVDNELIISNLFYLDSIGAKIILRCPMIPSVNIDKEHLSGIIEISKKLKNLVEINLEPYHNIGVSKRKLLGFSSFEDEFVLPNKEELLSFAKKIEEATKIKTVVM